jgi:oligopeptide transport system permease protein
MLAYTVRRIAGIIPTLVVIVTASFFIVRLAPGGPFDQEQTLPPPIRANLERAYGLDQPLGLQYLRYVGHLLQGDFGPSLRQRDYSVGELIAEGLPVSLTIGASAVLLAILAGITLGQWPRCIAMAPRTTRSAASLRSASRCPVLS